MADILRDLSSTPKELGLPQTIRENTEKGIPSPEVDWTRKLSGSGAIVVTLDGL